MPKLGKLDFLDLDNDKFPAIKIAKQCINEGVSRTAVFNSANEIAVGAFMNNQLYGAKRKYFEKIIAHETTDIIKRINNTALTTGPA